MPNTVTQTVLVDGPKRAHVHIFVRSDGNEGEFVNKKIIDVLNDVTLPDSGIIKNITLEQVWYSQSFFDGLLSVDDTVPVDVWVLPVGSDSHIDFRSFGGIKVPVDLDGQGNILLSTNGFAPANSWGSYVIQFRKD